MVAERAVRAGRPRRRPRAPVPRGARRRRWRCPRRGRPARRHRRGPAPPGPRRVAPRPGGLPRHPAGIAPRLDRRHRVTAARSSAELGVTLRGGRVGPRAPGGGDPTGRRSSRPTRRRRRRRGRSRSGSQPRPRRPPMPSRLHAPTRAGPPARAGPPRKPNAWSPGSTRRRSASAPGTRPRPSGCRADLERARIAAAAPQDADGR